MTGRVVSQGVGLSAVPCVLATLAFVKIPVAVVILGLAGNAMHVGATTKWAAPLWGDVGHLRNLQTPYAAGLFAFEQAVQLSPLDGPPAPTSQSDS